MLTINQPVLTQEQINVIPIYRHKWQQIALNREPINRERAKTAIDNAYSFLNLNKPTIVFFSNHNDALEYIYNEISNSWGKLENSSFKNPVASQFTQKIIGNLNNKIQGEIYEKLQNNLDNGLADRIANKIADRFAYHRIFSIIWAHSTSPMLSATKNAETNDITKAFFDLFLTTGFVFNRYISSPLWDIQKQIGQFWGSSTEPNNFSQMYEVLFTGKFPQNNNNKQNRLPQIELSSNTVNVIVPSVMADYAYYIDYLHEALNCDRDNVKWNIFNDIITNCGWIFPYEQTVLVCDRVDV